MANKTPLATWLYSKRQELNPRFREFNWPSKYLPGVFDFSTTVVWNGIEAEGRGVDALREVALEKSVAEAIERLICKFQQFDSVGFAIAGTHDPLLHAQHEALERYFLNRHIEGRLPFQLIEESELVSNQFRISNPDAKISFYRMATPDEMFGIVCSMNLPAKARSLGFALSDTLENSVRRATLEALPNYAWLADKDMRHEYDGSESMPWHIDTDFVTKIDLLLGTNSKPETQRDIFDIPKLQKLDVPYAVISILKDAPIQAARFVVQESGAFK